MAFNINAHVILDGPKNIKAVSKKIQRELGGLTATIDLKVPKNVSSQINTFNKGINTLSKNMTGLKNTSAQVRTQLNTLTGSFVGTSKATNNLSKAQKGAQSNLKKTTQTISVARNEMREFGKDAALAIRRFGAFTVATGVVFGFTRAITGATKAALDYEREIVKVVQVTGAGVATIGRLNKSIQELSVTLGVDANKLAELSRIFAQTGQTIDQVRASIKAVARSSLAPSFGEMKNTAEGLIAALAQFNIQANKSEAVLAGLNAVSKKFAVEAEDLVSVIRRAGGVFSASAGQFEEPIDALNQLIGIFTAVRSTTRETADTIAVGLRTIFTRIQRRGTIEFLKQFNIELVDARGNFIGLFPAFQQLSKGLKDIIKSGDALTLSAITEELGGIRQVGKLIPAITQFNKALEATKIAGEAAKKGLGKDVALALQPLGKQFELLQQRFNALIRDISQSNAFQNLGKVALSVANAFLSVAETLKPLLPLITTFATIKLTKGMVEFGRGFFGGLKKGGGAGGVGARVGGAISGGSARTSAQGSARAVSSQSALTNALKTHGSILGNNNTNLQKMSTELSRNSTAIANSVTQMGNLNNQMVGVLGNVINALNRASSGGFGARPKKFAKGGPVSGPSHAQGGVPAILEGGEYVIPKKLATGGLVSSKVGLIALEPPGAGVDSASDTVEVGKLSGGKASKGSILDSLLTNSNLPGGIAGNASFIKQWGKKSDPTDRSGKRKNIDSIMSIIQNRAGFKGQKKFTAVGAAFPGSSVVGQEGNQMGSVEQNIKDSLESTFTVLIESTAGQLANSLPGAVSLTGFNPQSIIKQIGLEDATGKIFEGAVAALGPPFVASTDQDPFDFPSGIGEELGGAYDKFKDLASIATDAKKQLHTKNLKQVAGSKVKNLLAGDINESPEFQALKAFAEGVDLTGAAVAIPEKMQYKAAGGNIFKPRGTDTVPAMLTPGEFVINKKSAQNIGYSKLGKMNHLAKGGVASKGNIMQYFREGTTAENYGFRDVDRGTGQIIRTIDHMNRVFDDMLKSLSKDAQAVILAGSVGGVTSTTQMETSRGSTGAQIDRAKRQRRGAFSPSTKTISATMGVGTESTVVHEAGHAADWELGGGEAASKQKGTFQFEAVEAIKEKMAKDLAAAGEKPKHIEEYLSKNVELFAELFQKSTPQVRSILLSTTNAATGMQLLADHLAEGEELFGDLHKSLPDGGITPVSPTASAGLPIGGPATPAMIETHMPTPVTTAVSTTATATAPAAPPDDPFKELRAALAALTGEQTKISKSLETAKAREKAAQTAISMSEGTMVLPPPTRLLKPGEKPKATRGSASESQWKELESANKAVEALTEKFNKLEAAVEAAGNKLKKEEGRTQPSGGPSKEERQKLRLKERFNVMEPVEFAAKEFAKQLALGRSELEASVITLNKLDTAMAETAAGQNFLKQKEEELARAMDARAAELKEAGVDPIAARALAKKEMEGARGTDAEFRGGLSREALEAGSETIGRGVDTAELAAEAAKSANDMSKLSDALGSGLTAVGAWTAALSSMDFSSPMAAMSSLATLAMAVDQTKNTLSSLGEAFPSLKNSVLEMIGVQTASATASKASAAADVLDTTATTAGASSETAETAANILATKSEMAEAAANAKSAGSGLISNLKEGIMEGLGEFKPSKMKKTVGKMPGMDRIGKMFQSLKGTKIGKGVGNLLGKGGAGGKLKMLGPALKSFGPKLAGLAKSMGKLATGGSIGGAIAQLVIGPIADGIDSLVRGKKEEIAPGVVGVRGSSTGAAGTAGALTGAAKGAAVGAGIGMMTGPLAPILAPLLGIGGAVLGAIKGGFTEAFAQAEFNAIDALQKSSERLSKTFDKLSKLGDDAGSQALGQVNKDLEQVLGDTQKAFNASRFKATIDQVVGLGFVIQNLGNPLAMFGTAMTVAGSSLKALGFEGAGNFVSGGMDLEGLITGTGGVQLSTTDLSMADIGAEGFWDTAGNMLDKTLGAIPLIGNVFGSRSRTKERANVGRGKVVGDALKLAASQIDASTFEKLDEAMNSMMGKFVDNLGALGDKSSLQALAGLETVAPDLNELQSSDMINDSFKTLSNTLNGAGAATGEFSKELDKFLGNAIKAHLIKDVADQLAILEKSSDPSKATSLANAFGDLQGKVDFAKASVSDLDAAMAEMEQEGTLSPEIKQIIESRKEEAIAAAQQAATTKLVEMASRAARKAMDALAAGLDQFSAQMGGAVNRLTGFMGDLESEFSMIGGKKTIQEDQSFNPFENIASATDSEIDAGINRLSAMAPDQATGGAAFRDMGAMARGQRDFPRMMRDTLNELQLGKTTDAEVSNVDVLGAITKKIADEQFGGDASKIPPQMLKALEETITGAALRQGGGEVFSMAALTELFETDGDVLKILGEVSEKAAQSLADADNALMTFRNSVLKTANLQAQMMQARLDGELAMMDKAQSIQDRIDKALGRGAQSFQKAQTDLRKRLEMQAGGGTGRGLGGANVLDPAALGARLTELNERRDTVREQLALKPGQSVQGTGQGAEGLTGPLEENSSELAKLNQEINGTESALRELSNDTKMLAAIENKVAEAQARAAASQNSAMSLMKGFKALKSGEMSIQDFNKNFTKPMQAIEDVFAGDEISSNDAIDMLDKLTSGDALTKGLFEQKLMQTANVQGVDTTDPQAMKKFRDEFMKDLFVKAGVQTAAEMDAGGLSGMGEKLLGLIDMNLDARSEAEQLGDTMQKIGDVQIAAQKTMLDQNQAKMAQTLDDAHLGFQRAAIDFQSAVSMFAAMRGGVDTADITKATQDVTGGKAKLDATKAQLEEARAGFDPNAENAEDQQRLIKDLESKVKLEEQALKLAQERLKVLQKEKQSSDLSTANANEKKKEAEEKKAKDGAKSSKDQAKNLQRAKDMRAKQVKQLEGVSGTDEHFFERAMGRWAGVGEGEGKGLTGFSGKGMADTVLSRTGIGDIQDAEQLGGMFTAGDNWNLNWADTDQKNLMTLMMRQMGQQFGGQGDKGNELGKELEKMYLDAFEGGFEIHDLTKQVRDRLLEFAKDEAAALEKVKLDPVADAAAPKSGGKTKTSAPVNVSTKKPTPVTVVDTGVDPNATIGPTPTEGIENINAQIAKVEAENRALAPIAKHDAIGRQLGLGAGGQFDKNEEKLKELKAKRGELITEQGITPASAATGNISQDAAMLIVGTLDRCCEKTTNRLDTIITVLGGELSAIKDQDAAINAREATVSPEEKGKPTDEAGLQAKLEALAKEDNYLAGIMQERMAGAQKGNTLGPASRMTGEDFKAMLKGGGASLPGLDQLVGSASQFMGISDGSSPQPTLSEQAGKQWQAFNQLSPAEQEEAARKSIQDFNKMEAHPAKREDLKTPTDIAAAATVADAAIKKQEGKPTTKKGPAGGVIGELQKLNDTAAKMLQCLCGDIFPEVAAVKEEAASGAKVAEQAKVAQKKTTDAKVIGGDGAKSKEARIQEIRDFLATPLDELNKNLDSDKKSISDRPMFDIENPDLSDEEWIQKMNNAADVQEQAAKETTTAATVATKKASADARQSKPGGMSAITLPTGPDAKTEAEKKANREEAKRRAEEMKKANIDPLAFAKLPEELKKSQNLDASEFGVKDPAAKLKTFRNAALNSPDAGIRDFAGDLGGTKAKGAPKIVQQIDAAMKAKREADKKAMEEETKNKAEQAIKDADIKKKETEKAANGEAGAGAATGQAGGAGGTASKPRSMVGLLASIDANVALIASGQGGGGGAAAGTIGEATKAQLTLAKEESARKIAAVDKSEQEKLQAIENERMANPPDLSGTFGDENMDTVDVARKKQMLIKMDQRTPMGPAGIAKQQKMLERAKKEAARGDTSLMEAGTEMGVPAFKAFKDEEVKKAQEAQLAQNREKEQAIRAQAEQERMAISERGEATRGDLLSQAGVTQMTKKTGPIATASAAGGNVMEQLQNVMKGQELAASITTAFTDGGNILAQKMTEAFNAIPREIQLNAQLGPITVNLAGGKVLEEMKNGILEEMRGAVAEAIQSKFNNDGTVKDPSTANTNVPFKKNN